MPEQQPTTGQPTRPELDAVIVGGGFAGVYSLYKLKSLGLRARVFEAGSGVGGTWFWNRYPGARCDVESIDYSYSFSPELQQEWTWKERFAPQAEILAYINAVVDRFGLRQDIQCSSRVTTAVFDEQDATWTVTVEGGETVTARHCIFATGCLSIPYTPDIPGLADFKGELYHTGQWPHHDVDLAGKRVGVVGTGSSGIQFVASVAPAAQDLYVFQRTPSYSIPARNRLIDQTTARELKAGYEQRRAASRDSRRGYPAPPEVADKSAMDADPQERAWRYEALWRYGGPLFTSTFNDLMRNAESNRTAADFFRGKLDLLVDDPMVAEKLKPRDYPIGGKRICVDTDYYTTFNRGNVHLVDVRESPIVTVTEHGLRTESQEYELDVLVMATGYDAMTGALRQVDIRGRDGRRLTESWADGPRTYLGLMIAGFPNLFLVTGPGSPSVLCNMVLAIEQSVDWIAGCVSHARANGFDTVAATAEAESAWVQHVNEVADRTLYPSVNSWRSGTNIPGKPRVFMPYVGGFNTYTQRCDQEARDGYPGLRLDRTGAVNV
jgi:cation diffusion facilitator CzcD-associated flavoprotein CzcO